MIQTSRVGYYTICFAEILSHFDGGPDFVVSSVQADRQRRGFGFAVTVRQC